MKSRIGFLLLVTFALCVTWMLVPSSRAGGSGKSAITKAPAAVSDGHAVRLQRGGRVRVESAGLPNTFDERAPMSAAVATFLGGRNATFNELDLLGNFDGREDYAADRAAAFDDFTGLFLEPDATVTRVAISEHTVANGFNENVGYYGDTQGNFYVGTDLNPMINPGPGASIDTLRQINIPELIRSNASGGFTLLNPQAGDCTDDQVTITGIAVNPVADLGDFGLCGTIGEVVYVSTLDTVGCSANAFNQPFRSRIFAFAATEIADGVSPAGVVQTLRNVNSNAGIAIDDDGSLYFHLVDNIQNTNGAIFKVSEGARTVAGCAVNPRVNRVISSIPSGLSGGIQLTSAQGTGAFPILTAAGMRLSNFSGPATTWGNVVAIATAPGNILYAALARSFVASDDAATQATEGAFPNPAALGATPSAIVSLVDLSGATDFCSSQATTAGTTVTVPGTIPVGDGLADGPALT